MARYTIGSGVEADHAKVVRCLGEERIRNYTFYTFEELKWNAFHFNSQGYD
jgi:hypothetical protein